MSKILSVSNLVKSYHSSFLSPKSEDEILKDISFDLNQGEIVGLMGPNGAGKTTLINILLGISEPTQGAISYFSKDFFQHKKDILKEISFGSSNLKLSPQLTIKENLNFFAKIYDIPDYNLKIRNLLLRFEIFEHQHKKIVDLSAGQSNKASIVKAFLPVTRLIILDEPTAFLDYKSIEITQKFILELRKTSNVTFFLSSHNKKDIFEICDRVIVLNHGKIIANDVPSKIQSLGLSYLA